MLPNKCHDVDKVTGKLDYIGDEIWRCWHCPESMDFALAIDHEFNVWK